MTSSGPSAKAAVVQTVLGADDRAAGAVTTLLTPAELLAEDPKIAVRRKYLQQRKESLHMVKKLLAAF